MSESRVLWWVIVDRAAEEHWRATLGQADINHWCAVHGWKATDVLSSTVMVSALSDGRIEVMAEVVRRDADGHMMIRADGEVDSHLELAEYRRSLPEGIAPVRRP